VYLKVHFQSVKSGWAFEKMKLQAQAFCFSPPIIPARYHRKKKKRKTASIFKLGNALKSNQGSSGSKHPLALPQAGPYFWTSLLLITENVMPCCWVFSYT
jgi:hypothetical protein